MADSRNVVAVLVAGGGWVDSGPVGLLDLGSAVNGQVGKFGRLGSRAHVHWALRQAAVLDLEGANARVIPLCDRACGAQISSIV